MANETRYIPVQVQFNKLFELIDIGVHCVVSRTVYYAFYEQRNDLGKCDRRGAHGFSPLSRRKINSLALQLPPAQRFKRMGRRVVGTSESLLRILIMLT